MEAKLRNNGLESAFKETGGPGVNKERKRKANRKKNFLDEIITLKIIDINDEDIKGCTFKIMRRRLTPEFIQETVDGCPEPIKVDYCYDSTGEVMWLQDLQLNAKAPPEYYVLVPLLLRSPYDICEDFKYEGQTCFIIQYVPYYARDEQTLVDEETLRQFLLFAILEEDPFVPPILQQIENQKSKIKDTDRRLKQIVKQEFLEPDGKEMLPEKAELEREAMFKAVGEERNRQEAELKRREQLLETHKAWRMSMGVSLEQGDFDENSNTVTWFVRFFGVADARDMELRLLQKNDYSGIRLACGSADKKLPPWVGRSKSVPDGGKEYLPDYTMLQVNIAGVRIMRIPHGVGVYKSLDRTSVEISAEKFYYFYGNWYSGKKVGYGLEVNDSGAYIGRFNDNWKDGYGKWDIGNGTSIKGIFGKHVLFPENETSLNPANVNPYLDGEPHCNGKNNNKIEVLFGDGSFYRGSMKNGRITGYGEYESAFGEVMCGNFLNGKLNDKSGYYLNHVREEYRGSFVHGELHGYAEVTHPKGHKFVGYYDRSLRNGRGEELYKNKGVYRGYFVNGFRHGKGEIDYQRRDMKEYLKKKAKEKRKEEDEKRKQEEANKRGGDIKNKNKTNEEEEPLEEIISEFQMRFQGHLMAGNIIRGSGTTTDADDQVLRILSISNKESMEKILRFLKYASSQQKRDKRILEKMTDMDLYIRKEIMRKKTRIYTQQKHFTKKTLYDSELYGNIDEQILKSRADVRHQRLERVKALSDSFARKAFIPRMTKKPSMFPNEGLHGVFTHINPEPDSQDRDVVKQTLPVVKAVVSDFEEIQERGRFLKYDNMIARAEADFSKRKKDNKV